LAREIAQKGRQNALRYIGKVADDGDALAAIENGGNLIPELARGIHTRPTNLTLTPFQKQVPRFQ